MFFPFLDIFGNMSKKKDVKKEFHDFIDKISENGIMIYSCESVFKLSYSRSGQRMKKSDRQVFHALILVFQFGINMLVPIFMCSLLGIWIGDKTGISWMMIPFFFVGALAGFTNIYKMARKLYDKEDGDHRHAKKN